MNFKDAFQLSLKSKEFVWTNKRVIMTKTKVEGQEVIFIIDTGCSRVIISKGYMSRIRLEMVVEIDFTLNNADKTAEKQRLIFEKMNIGVGRSMVALLVIVVDRSHFDLLLGVNWIKEVEAEFNFEKNQLIIEGETIMI